MAIPVVSDCKPMLDEHEPLWIVAMVTVSAISTLTAVILRKARATRAPLAPPLPRTGGKEGRGGGGDGINRTKIMACVQRHVTFQAPIYGDRCRTDLVR